MTTWRHSIGDSSEGSSRSDRPQWMTPDEVCKFLGKTLAEVEELMMTGQVDVDGSTSTPMILGKSVRTYDDLRKRLG